MHKLLHRKGFFGFFFFSFSAMLMLLIAAVQGDLIEMCDESGAELCLRGEFTARARERRT